jgi:hypothetical protein
MKPQQVIKKTDALFWARYPVIARYVKLPFRVCVGDRGKPSPWAKRDCYFEAKPRIKMPLPLVWATVSEDEAFVSTQRPKALRLF